MSNVNPFIFKNKHLLKISPTKNNILNLLKILNMFIIIFFYVL